MALFSHWAERKSGPASTDGRQNSAKTIARASHVFQKHRVGSHRGHVSFNASPFVIKQENHLYVKWSLIIFLSVIYTTVATPYIIATDDGVKKIDGMFIFDRVLDILFICDLCLQFFVSFEDDISMNEVKDLRLIAMNYMSGWLWIDLVSVFPYDLIAFFIDDGAVGRLSSLSIIRMFRMFKILKLAAFKKIFARMEANYPINYDYLELAKYLIAVSFIVHFLGCGLMIIGHPQNSKGSTWITEGGFDDLDSSERYLVAAYWATMTLSTIGYGDITLVNSTERAYAIFAMLVGASMYAYVVGGITGIIVNMNKEREEYAANLAMLNSFMEEIKLPNSVQRKARDFYARTYDFKKTDNQKHALELLSPHLQAVVGLHMNAFWVEQVPVLKQLPEELRGKLALALIPKSFSPRECLVQRGEPIKELVILKKGTVMESLMILSVPYHFGQEIILSGPGRSKVNVIALQYCDAYCLPKTALIDLKERYPVAHKKIRHQAIKMAFSHTLGKLAKCFKRGLIREISEYNPRDAKLIRGGSASFTSMPDSDMQQIATNERLDHIEASVNEIGTSVNKILAWIRMQDGDDTSQEDSISPSSCLVLF